ncbi:hypothetical protein IGI04_029931 [Brassica rapa subsp. trilocularis]|uniref:RNase H type-1 domain-containing protein n=1 Tax=Brassica rapa subsp. trilocularis TaxID=1813537 RepID=A0ABQ7LRY5_BRACM|nr:hypothetical protein IGI04_029931 [Brassica rapa subsp. trilocularis]
MRRERDTQHRSRDDRSYQNRRFQRTDIRERSSRHGNQKQNFERVPYSKSHRNIQPHRYDNRCSFQGPQSFYREIPKSREFEGREESTSSKNLEKNSDGCPLKNIQTPLPKEALEVAIGEVREVMNQYINVPDPTESAARRARVRLAEKHGEIEESAAQMVRASLAGGSPLEMPHMESTAERIPVASRLSFPPEMENSGERIPATLRLSSAPLTETEQEKLPMVLRLGPLSASQVPDLEVATETRVKRRPGRPPGKSKAQQTPKIVEGACSRKRKIQQTKATPCRRKIPTDAGQSSKTAPKVKMLIWKSLRGALPVGTRLEDRHLQVDPRCKRCGEPESIIHLFYQCEFAKAVWQAAPFVGEVDFSGMIDLREFWNHVKTRQCLPPTGIAAVHLAPWIMWGLWTARNKLVFSNIRVETEDSLTKVIVMAREWQDGQVKLSKAHKKRLPQQGSASDTILRSDAAWNVVTARAGLGWVLTHNDISSSYSLVENNVLSPLMAEGLALREALQTCKEVGIMNLRVESDSKILINCVLNDTSVPELYGVLADILILSTFFDSVCFNWIPREENYAADLLAKHVLGVSEAFMTSN